MVVIRTARLNFNVKGIFVGVLLLFQYIYFGFECMCINYYTCRFGLEEQIE